MTLTEIAVKNLLRRKAKAAFIVAGLVVGVATAVAVIGYVEAMTMEINHKLEKFGANILVLPRTDQLTLSYGGLSLGGVSFEMQHIQQSDLSKIDTIPNAGNIAAVGPMALGAVEIGDTRVLLAGVDFNATGILKPWWKIKGRKPAENELLVGADAARILNLAVGRPAVVDGRTMTVSGVLMATGSQDDHLIFSDLISAQRLLQKPGHLSMIEVAALCNACPIEDMVRQIATALPAARVMAIQQVVKGRMEMLKQLRRFSYGICAVLGLIGGLVVLVTLMGAVRERRSEIGIFRAIGFRRKHVMRIIYMEAGMVSFIAGILGVAMGWLGAQAGIRWISDSPSAIVPFDPKLAIGAVLLALLIGMMASAYPAWTASRMDPNQALRAL